MNAMTNAKSPEPGAGFILRGWHVLAMLLTFFAVVIGVDVGFSVIAVRTFPGEDIRNSYVQGNLYNETLAERAKQAALGWTAEASLGSGNGGAIVTLRLRDAKGEPLTGATVTGRLRRPATTKADRTLVFSSTGGGTYIAPAGDLQAGAWDLAVRATRGSATFDIGARLTNGGA